MMIIMIMKMMMMNDGCWCKTLKRQFEALMELTTGNTRETAITLMHYELYNGTTLKQPAR